MGRGNYPTIYSPVTSNESDWTFLIANDCFRQIISTNYSLLHVSELDVGADPEVQRLLLAVADQLLLPHAADGLARQVARRVTVHVVPTRFSSS